MFFFYNLNQKILFFYKEIFPFHNKLKYIPKYLATKLVAEINKILT